MARLCALVRDMASICDSTCVSRMHTHSHPTPIGLHKPSSGNTNHRRMLTASMHTSQKEGAHMTSLGYEPVQVHRPGGTTYAVQPDNMQAGICGLSPTLCPGTTPNTQQQRSSYAGNSTNRDTSSQTRAFHPARVYAHAQNAADTLPMQLLVGN